MSEGNNLEHALIRALPRMLSVTMRILRDTTEAQDAVQDASLLALRNVENYEGKGEVEAWLHKIALNSALMRLRKRTRLAEDQLDDLVPQYDEYGVFLGDPEWRDINSEALLAHSETRRKVIEAIDNLPERSRILIVLRDIEELSTRETAEALELSEGAVKTGLHRARVALKRLLEPLFSEGSL